MSCSLWIVLCVGWGQSRALELEPRILQEAQFPRGCASSFEDIDFGVAVRRK